jgi:hypothetical protein
MTKRPERIAVSAVKRLGLVTLLASLLVALVGLLTPPASASPLLHPETRVAAIAQPNSQLVGPSATVAAVQGRERAPSYDSCATGSSVAAEDAGLSSVEQQTFDDVANNPNNLDHVFAEKHNFGDLINQFGSQQNVLKQMILSLRSASLPEAGVFNTVVDLGGTSVEVNGAVVNGVPRIGTAWVVK